MNHAANVGIWFHSESSSSWLKTTMTHVRESPRDIRESSEVGVWTSELMPWGKSSHNQSVQFLGITLTKCFANTQSYFHRCGTSFMHWEVYQLYWPMLFHFIFSVSLKGVSSPIIIVINTRGFHFTGVKWKVTANKWLNEDLNPQICLIPKLYHWVEFPRP